MNYLVVDKIVNIWFTVARKVNIYCIENVKRETDNQLLKIQICVEFERRTSQRRLHTDVTSQRHKNPQRQHFLSQTRSVL